MGNTSRSRKINDMCYMKTLKTIYQNTKYQRLSNNEGEIHNIIITGFIIKRLDRFMCKIFLFCD